ncbi:MAG: hypothetical protein WBD22_10990 [Pyrinomonadaceae bacterium]
MAANEFVGTWVLAGHKSINEELDISHESQAFETEMAEWLYGNSDDAVSGLEPVSGLRLSVAGNGTFTELKTSLPEIDWFDAEGVLDDEVNPFSGIYNVSDSRAYLTFKDPPEWSRSEDKARIRYDDGDTKICDSLFVKDDGLVRTISVVSDDLYLNRVILRYERG